MCTYAQIPKVHPSNSCILGSIVIPKSEFRLTIASFSCLVFQQYLEMSNKQIDEIVELVRGKLSKMARITLGALTVIDVHGNAAISAWPAMLAGGSP